MRYKTEAEATARHALPGDTTVCRWYSPWYDPAVIDDTQIIGVSVDQEDILVPETLFRTEDH